MMSYLQELIASSNGLALLGEIALRAAVILVLAAAVMLLLRRASSAARHLGWAVTVTVVVFLPLISLLTPDWRVLPRTSAELPPVKLEAAAPVVQSSFAANATVIEGNELEPEITGTTTAAPEAPRALQADQIVLLVWVAGVLLMLGAIGLGFLRVALIARRARHITDGETLSEIAQVSAQLGAGSVLALEVSDGAMPMTWGVLRPRLLLPTSARQWSRAKLQAVLRHELAHVRRRDSFWQLLAELACALHWFNPLAWYAARQMRIEREHACDDEVLNAGSRASEYASELLEIARSLRSARATSLAAIAMAQPSQLEGRLLAVLDEKRVRKTIKRKWPAWLAAVVVVGPVAGASPKLPVEQPGTESMRATPKPITSRVAFASAGEALTPVKVAGAASLAQERTVCSSDETRGISINSHSKEDRQEVKWEAGGCKGRMDIRGKIRLAGDLTGIERLSNGGDFRLWVKDRGDTRVVTAKPAGNAIAYEYTVDGDKRPWNTEGRAWFASILSYVVRTTGFAADERVDYLLKQQGPSGVLAEVEKMSSDYVQRLYLQKLISKSQLNGAALESVLATAKRSLQSDYEMAELLIAVANKFEFTEGVRRAFINASGTLQSDYEHRRALSAVLKKGGLSSENVAAMLLSAQSIDSNYEKAELLLSIIGRFELDPAMRSAYLASARKLNSDYEKGRVFKALLRQGAATGPEAADLLESVATMSSDHERSEVLRLLPASALSSAQVQTAYLKVITDMKSDFEMRRSLTALMEAGRLTNGALNMVLSAAAKMNSDYERVELLLPIIRAYRLTPEQRQSVILAVDRMKSEYERGRVSSALVRQMAAPPPPPAPARD